MQAKINHNGKSYQVQYEATRYVDGVVVHKLEFDGRLIKGKTLDSVVKKFKEIVEDGRKQ